ncbi:MAG: hypothetical protein QOE37_313 [Microbacteriaceae bacterium]|jgi:hypothetical protein|nr:hypothetical protein [Microbacteriaceae bacterium]
MTNADVELILVRQAERAGIARRSLARAAETGRLVQLRRGVYVDGAVWATLDPLGGHLLRIRALQAVSPRPLVVSHWSAAALRSLPVPRRQLERLHVTVPPGSGRAIQGVRAHDLPLLDWEVEDVEGVPCTTWARTVLDVAAASSFADGVAVADAALHGLEPALRGPAKELLVARWSALPPRRAVNRVPAVLDFADGDAESPGESVSRVSMHSLGLPRPVLQQVFNDGRGFAGKVDFWFPGPRVIGEMDGRSKYLDPRLNRSDPARVVYDEKRREDRLRALVRGFVRWDWAEASTPSLLGAKLAAAGVRPA